ncbi:MAG: hypothetical protein KA144_11100 [Xanthomonadaceae bacterium]|nr:hypothetical protein [Xanthomonadaceae bacterium]
MTCNTQNSAPLIWAVLVAAIFIWVVYAFASAKRNARKMLENRKERLPILDDAPRVGSRYDLRLSDGRVFDNVELLGTTDPEPGAAALGDWSTLLIVGLPNGKKAYLRPYAVRVIQET